MLSTTHRRLVNFALVFTNVLCRLGDPHSIYLSGLPSPLQSLTVPQFSIPLTLLKSISQFFCRWPISLSLFDAFLVTGIKLSIFAKNTTKMSLWPSPHYIEEFIMPVCPVMLTSISWLRWVLWDFSIVKLPSFPL